jgi:hypothetical protein
VPQSHRDQKVSPQRIDTPITPHDVDLRNRYSGRKSLQRIAGAVSLRLARCNGLHILVENWLAVRDFA